MTTRPKYYERSRREGRIDALNGWSTDTSGRAEYGQEEAYLEGYRVGEEMLQRQKDSTGG